jgi:hypothetical protein
MDAYIVVAWAGGVTVVACASCSVDGLEVGSSSSKSIDSAPGGMLGWCYVWKCTFVDNPCRFVLDGKG